MLDWDGDGKKDLVIGDADGQLHLFLNEGTDDVPVMDVGAVLTFEDGSTIDVGGFVRPIVADFNNDFVKDIVVGNEAGQVLLISGEQSCAYSISPTSSPTIPAGGGSGSFSVSAGSGCTWSASSNDSWITITSGSNGSGNGTVGYSVSFNGSASGRTGTITAAGETYTVSQAAQSCSYSISPTTSPTIPAGGGSGSFSVSAGSGCTWSASSNDSWITITSGSNGSGNGTVGYSVSFNGSASGRTGTITAAGETYTVNQATMAGPAIPTVSAWGTAIFALVVAAVGTAVLRARKSIVVLGRPDH